MDTNGIPTSALQVIPDLNGLERLMADCPERGTGLIPLSAAADFFAKTPSLFSDRLYEGVDLAEKFADEISRTSGSTAERKRWNWINGRIATHNYDGLHIGDYLKLKVTAKKDTDGANSGNEVEEEHLMQISGMNTAYNTGYPETHGESSTVGLVPVPPHIDFISKDCLNTPVMWNTTSWNRNSGTGTGADDATDQPYLCSNVKKYLIEKILPTIDPEISALFTEKVQILERRAYNASTALTDSTGHHWYNMGKLWLPTEYEVYGAGIFGTLPWSATQVAQYPIFAGKGTARIKGAGPNGPRCSWWLACVMGDSSTNACVVTSYGSAPPNAVTNAGIRVPVCFRISAPAE